MKIDEIDGTTRIFAIIGDPIRGVRSPSVFNGMFSRNDINAVMVAVPAATQVTRPELDTVAAPVSDDCQAAMFVTICAVPSENRAVAINCAGVPLVTVVGPNKAIEVTTRLTTVTEVLPVTPA